MCRFPRRWLLHSRVYGCIERARRSQCSMYAHLDWLKAADTEIISHTLAMRFLRSPLQPSESSAFRLYAAMHRVMHQALSRFSTHREKCVDYMGASQRNTRQAGLSPQKSSVRHASASASASNSMTVRNGSSDMQGRLLAEGIYHAECSPRGYLRIRGPRRSRRSPASSGFFRFHKPVVLFVQHANLTFIANERE